MGITTVFTYSSCSPVINYGSCSPGRKHLVNRHITSPTKCLNISRITTLQFPIKLTLIRFLLGAAGPSVITHTHTTHKVRFHTYKLTLGGGAATQSNSTDVHTV